MCPGIIGRVEGDNVFIDFNGVTGWVPKGALEDFIDDHESFKRLENGDAEIAAITKGAPAGFAPWER